MQCNYRLICWISIVVACLAASPANAQSAGMPPKCLSVEDVGKKGKAAYRNACISQNALSGKGTALIFPYRLCPDAAAKFLAEGKFLDPNPYKRALAIRLLGLIDGHDQKREQLISRALTSPYTTTHNEPKAFLEGLKKKGIDPAVLFGKEGATRSIKNPILVSSAVAAATTLPVAARIRIYKVIEPDLHEIIYRIPLSGSRALVPFLATLPNRSQIAVQLIQWAKDGPPGGVRQTARVPRPSVLARPRRRMSRRTLA